MVPAFNEGDTIGEVVQGYLEVSPVIVVDDGSQDDTAQLAATGGALVVKHKNNEGYDSAILSGLLAASKRGFKVVVTADADGQHSSVDILSVGNLVSENYPLAIGIRPNFQRFGEVVFSKLTQCIYGLKDPLCGMKAYYVPMVIPLVSEPPGDSIGTLVLARALGAGLRFKQVPIGISERRDCPRIANGIFGNWKIFVATCIFFLKSRNDD